MTRGIDAAGADTLPEAVRPAEGWRAARPGAEGTGAEAAMAARCVAGAGRVSPILGLAPSVVEPGPGGMASVTAELGAGGAGRVSPILGLGLPSGNPVPWERSGLAESEGEPGGSPGELVVASSPSMLDS
ncbi:MAG: hypothetical protein ACYCTL_06355 [Acidimicrobiales bacterium]